MAGNKEAEKKEPPPVDADFSMDADPRNADWMHSKEGWKEEETAEPDTGATIDSPATKDSGREGPGGKGDDCQSIGEDETQVCRAAGFFWGN